MNKKIDGVVITFNDTTAAIMVEKELREVIARLKKQIVVTLEAREMALQVASYGLFSPETGTSGRL